MSVLMNSIRYVVTETGMVLDANALIRSHGVSTRNPLPTRHTQWMGL